MTMLPFFVASLSVALSPPRTVSIVTGGTRGIGFGIASVLARKGQDLILTFNRDCNSAASAASQLQKLYGCRTSLVEGDITEEEVVRLVFQTFDADFADTHRLGACVHSAGQFLGVTSPNSARLEKQFYTFGDSTPLPEPAYDYYVSMYGKAFARLCEASVQRMRDGGSLVGISSPGCNLLYRPQLGYDLPGSGKTLMEYTSRLVALSSASKNINCNIVVPGPVATSAWNRLAEARDVPVEEVLSSIRGRTPLPKEMLPEDVGEVVSFLTSPSGRFVTGTVVQADGGFHLRN